MSAGAPVVGGVVSGWIACSFDDVTLLIPMEDAGARTDADELVPTAEGLELGMLRWQDELWPAYRLDRELEPVAWSEQGTLMGMRHRALPYWGVQFHPESVLTEVGPRLIGNFLALCEKVPSGTMGARPGERG